MSASFERAAIASVSGVMNVFCTHPAWFASLLRRSVVALTSARKVVASVVVPPDPSPVPGATTLRHAAAPVASSADTRREVISLMPRS